MNELSRQKLIRAAMPIVGMAHQSSPAFMLGRFIEYAGQTIADFVLYFDDYRGLWVAEGICVTHKEADTALAAMSKLLLDAWANNVIDASWPEGVKVCKPKANRPTIYPTSKL